MNFPRKRNRSEANGIHHQEIVIGSVGTRFLWGDGDSFVEGDGRGRTGRSTDDGHAQRLHDDTHNQDGHDFGHYAHFDLQRGRQLVERRLRSAKKGRRQGRAIPENAY